MSLLEMKFLLVVCVVAMLRCSGRFQSMSRELDQSALSALKRIMHATEESGFPPMTLPILMLLTALLFMFSQSVTTGVGR
jgi:hypothetical protein